jgi:hypothetical protein
MTTNEQSRLVSVYQFAQMKGVRPQYLYQKIRDHKVPANVLKYNNTNTLGDPKVQPYFILHKAEQWWSDLLVAREVRAQAAADRKVQVVAKPVAALDTVIEFLGTLEDKNATKTIKYLQQVKQVLETQNNQQ